MKHIHVVRHAASAVLAIFTSFLGFALVAPSSFALAVDFRTDANGRIPSPTGAGQPVPPAPRVVHTVVTGGMAGWLITLIAIAAALLTATIAVMMERARAARRRLTVSPA